MKKIDVADFDTKVCPIDSSAAAEFIYYMGKTEYAYNGAGVFFLKRKIKARVRVLKEEGKSNANCASAQSFGRGRSV
ncbi:MAG: hypothetical protein J5676_00635 [Bacteroidaceae bacterium]|nr:hypothetical protein [Bacteroidaceae bacterium]